MRYQETYDRGPYAADARQGQEAQLRLAAVALDRAAGEAGMRRLGIGALLGLARRLAGRACSPSPRTPRSWSAAVVAERGDGVAAADRAVARRATSRPVPVADAEYVQALCALRLFAARGRDRAVDPGAGGAAGRAGADRASPTMSAGSSTEPGGYAAPGRGRAEQFAISDERSPAEVAAMLDAAGYEPVWKDAFPLVG